MGDNKDYIAENTRIVKDNNNNNNNNNDSINFNYLYASLIERDT
jgi:hypothetical protein